MLSTQFFGKTPTKQRKYAERAIKDFCILARASNLPIDKQIDSVHMTLVWLEAMLDFERKEAKLRETQKKLQVSSQEAQNLDSRQELFKLATAMNTLIFYFSKEESDEQRKIFVTVVQSTIEKLRGKKASLEKTKLAELKESQRINKGL